MDADCTASDWPFLANGGEMGARMRGFSWSASPLGSPDFWPQSLRSMVSACLNSPLPGAVLWGPELRMLYNDAYLPLLGSYPGALGQPAAQVFGASWQQLSPQVYRALQTGCGFANQNVALPVLRRGGMETSYWNFTATPIRGEDGTIAGLLSQSVEIPGQILAGRELRGDRDRLARMFAQAPGFIAVLQGPEHRIEFANEAYETLNRCHDMIGKTVAQALPDAAGRGCLDLLNQVFASGEAVQSDSCEYPVQPMAGRPAEPLFVDYIYQPITDANGAVTGVFVQGADVTGRAQAERALRESNAYIRLLLDSTSEGFYAVDCEGNTALCNPAFLKMLGFASEADVVGRKLHDVIHHSHPDGTHYPVGDCPIYRCASSGAPAYVTDEYFYRQDGTAMPVEYWAHPIIRDGKLQGAICTFFDATERKRAEAALRASEEQFRTFAQSMLNHVWTARPDGQLNWLNERILEYSGLSEQLLLRDGLASFVHPDDAALADQKWLAAVASGVPYESEFRLRRADGIYRWHIARAVAIHGQADGILQWIGTNTDIEDQKNTVQALAHLNATLETQVQERTGELMAAEESLRQAQKMEAVGQLTGGIAHDFNNLLTGISGSLEILQARVVQGRFDELHRYLHVAQSAAKRAAALTHRLLAFSRRQTLDPRPIQINRLAAEMDDLIRRTTGPAIDLEFVAAPGLWNTSLDPNQLENALLNLCINARDAMPDGGRLTIETGNQWLDEREAKELDVAPGPYVLLCVSDSGTGMPADVVARAFDPFFTTKPLGEGTGLGLSMVYGFVRQSGGQARIVSAIGEGTKVCLYLPRHFGEYEDIDAPARTAEPARAEPGETVLVVDDEPSIRMLVAEVLQELGYVALEAEDGNSGLKILQSKRRIDLLITDVGLPGGINGRQLADAAIVFRPELKILFITGYAETAVVGDGNLKPGMHVMTKPFAMDALAARIKTIIVT